MAEQHFQFDKAKQEKEDTLLTEWGHFKYELVRWQSDTPTNC
jgi:hypothetical protein